MMGDWWAGFAGSTESFRLLEQHLPGLRIRREGEAVLLSGPCLGLSGQETLRADLAKFTNLANAVLVVSSSASPIKQHGQLFIEEKSGHRHHVLLAETGVYSSVVYPVTLSARGSTRKRQSRPLGVRVTELLSRSEQFAKASALLAQAGNDLREIHKAMEAIEKGHGGWPKKKDRSGRAAFCAALMVKEHEWEALHRTTRSERHAYPHDMTGPIFTASQVRAAVQHALKVWLEREVPL